MNILLLWMLLNHHLEIKKDTYKKGFSTSPKSIPSSKSTCLLSNSLVFVVHAYYILLFYNYLLNITDYKIVNHIVLYYNIRQKEINDVVDIVLRQMYLTKAFNLI